MIALNKLENIKKTNKIRINIITLFPIYNKMYNSNSITNLQIHVHPVGGLSGPVCHGQSLYEHVWCVHATHYLGNFCPCRCGK